MGVEGIIKMCAVSLKAIHWFGTVEISESYFSRPAPSALNQLLRTLTRIEIQTAAFVFIIQVCPRIFYFLSLLFERYFLFKINLISF